MIDFSSGSGVSTSERENNFIKANQFTFYILILMGLIEEVANGL